MNRSTQRTLMRVVSMLLPLFLRFFRGKKSSGATDSGHKGVSDSPTRKRVSGAATRSAPHKKASKRSSSTRDESTSPIGRLHAQGRSDQVITDGGIIVKCLPDDNEGSRHQRLLVEVDRTDITIKIAHNIDLAPRIQCREGDRVKFKGEYEYNDLGGAVHWTHHDPKKWHEGGWVEVNGQRYE
ncbi:MAG: DUF3465 domain-containing protein [Algisphaera sp.]